ncbi:MAG TPA: Rab family GTPase [Thermomicrobiaceae bacterium]|nr:Rab family GTPase [Thermomicrobiaceae bacterium]
MKTLKVIVGGEGNVGKTSLIRQYAKGKFSEARNITLGIDITTQQFSIGGEDVRLAIWDIEGQAGNRPNFYIGAQAAALVYDGTEPASLEALVQWHQRVHRYSSDTPVIVVCNKVDLGLTFPPVWGRVFARCIGARHGFVSAKTGDNVGQLFQLLAESAVDHAALAHR